MISLNTRYRCDIKHGPVELFWLFYFSNSKILKSLSRETKGIFVFLSVMTVITDYLKTDKLSINCELTWDVILYQVKPSINTGNDSKKILVTEEVLMKYEISQANYFHNTLHQTGLTVSLSVLK